MELLELVGLGAVWLPSDSRLHSVAGGLGDGDGVGGAVDGKNRGEAGGGGGGEELLSADMVICGVVQSQSRGFSLSSHRTSTPSISNVNNEESSAPAEASGRTVAAEAEKPRSVTDRPFQFHLSFLSGFFFHLFR